jgi:hypothetical protein
MADLKPLKSSNIAACGYDAESKTLTVQFKNGATHSYADVSAEHHAAMVAADSPGSYFHANIRNAFKSSKQ